MLQASGFWAVKKGKWDFLSLSFLCAESEKLKFESYSIGCEPRPVVSGCSEAGDRMSRQQ